jgi:hypothetical protein
MSLEIDHRLAALPVRETAGRFLEETPAKYPGGIAPDDAARSRVTEALDLHDRQPDPHLQAIVDWITHYFNFPMGYINIDNTSQGRMIVKAGLGDEPFEPHDRFRSLCRYVVAGNHPMFIPDLSKSPLAGDNEKIISNGLRAYVGVPLTTPEDVVLGTLCLSDFTPRQFTESQMGMLTAVSEAAMRYLNGEPDAAPWANHRQGHPMDLFERMGVAIRNDTWVDQQAISLAVVPGACAQEVADLGSVNAFFTLSDDGEAIICYPLTAEENARALAQQMIDRSGWEGAPRAVEADEMETWPELLERALER